MDYGLLVTSEEFEERNINTQFEQWVKPGRSFAIPLSLQNVHAELHWEFTSEPKVGLASLPKPFFSSLHLLQQCSLVARLCDCQ